MSILRKKAVRLSVLGLIELRRIFGREAVKIEAGVCKVEFSPPVVDGKRLTLPKKSVFKAGTALFKLQEMWHKMTPQETIYFVTNKGEKDKEVYFLKMKLEGLEDPRFVKALSHRNKANFYDRYFDVIKDADTSIFEKMFEQEVLEILNSLGEVDWHIECHNGNKMFVTKAPIISAASTVDIMSEALRISGELKEENIILALSAEAINEKNFRGLLRLQQHPNIAKCLDIKVNQIDVSPMPYTPETLDPAKPPKLPTIEFEPEQS